MVIDLRNHTKPSRSSKPDSSQTPGKFIFGQPSSCTELPDQLDATAGPAGNLPWMDTSFCFIPSDFNFATESRFRFGTAAIMSLNSGSFSNACLLVQVSTS